MFRHHSERPDPAVLTAHAEVEALLGRLGHDVSTLDDGGDATNRQALADASERYNTAGAQLGEATTLGELSVVRGIVIEGLHSTRLVRTRLGLDPGPEPAAVPAAPPAPEPVAQAPAWGSGRHVGSGLGGALGAGVAGGLLGMLGGEVLGDILGDGGGGGGGWGDNDGGGDWGGGGW